MISEYDPFRRVTRDGDEHSPGKILIVDDAAMMRYLLLDILKDEGYELEEASSGEEAVEKLARDDFHLVITDLVMPGLSGEDVLRAAKQKAPDIEVIVMTGYASVETAIRTMRLGAVDYITKPFNVDHVRTLVSKVLKESRLRQRLEEAESQKQLFRLDWVTGLYNRRTFHQVLGAERAKAKRDDRPLSLLLLNIDQFKAYNDVKGHQAGDRALQKLASVLKRASRGCDFVARYGGDQFAIILPETDQAEATELAQRVQSLVEKTRFDGEDARAEGRLSLSIGLATYPFDALNEEELIEKADQALRQAKALGRNRLCVFDA